MKVIFSFFSSFLIEILKKKKKFLAKQNNKRRRRSRPVESKTTIKNKEEKNEYVSHIILIFQLLSQPKLTDFALIRELIAEFFSFFLFIFQD